MTYDYLRGSIRAERRLWTDLSDGTGLRAADVGCGPLGWLRLPSDWVGPSGEVVGTEAADGVAEQARLTARSEGLANVSVVVDDVFHTALPERSFDLVHARFMLGAVGLPQASRPGPA